MVKVFKFEGWIRTNFLGYDKLSRFYHYCNGFPNETISLDFYGCEWFDANLCAVLDSMLYKLNKEQNLTFSADMNFLRANFDVLFRNGFLSDGYAVDDIQRSTLPSKSFRCDDKDGFCEYLSCNLIVHRGMPWHDDHVEERIQDDLLEVFCNAHHHANTKDPFFVAGQYYPGQGILKFTMVDLGDGFLPRINRATGGVVKTDLQAIMWAVSGNSTKMYFEQTPGSLGIRGMYKYATDNNGLLEIISGSGYWSSSHLKTITYGQGRLLERPYSGTTINLFFKKN